jgi:hypothetical protein
MSETPPAPDRDRRQPQAADEGEPRKRHGDALEPAVTGNVDGDEDGS